MPIDPQIILAQRPVDMPDVAKIQGEALAIQEGQARARDRVQAERDKQAADQAASAVYDYLNKNMVDVDGVKTWDRGALVPLLAHLPPAKSKELLDMLDQSDKLIKAANDHDIGLMQHEAGMIQATGGDPAVQAALMSASLDRMVQNNRIHASQAAPIQEALKRDPSKAQEIIARILDPEGKDVNKGDFTLNPGDNRYHAGQTTPYATGQAKQPTPPNVGSFEDYVTRKFGPSPTPAQIEQARKDYGEAGRAPQITVNTGQGSDVKETVAGMKDGTLPPLLPGRASKEYVAIMAEARRQGFDLAAAATDWMATQKHIATLNGSQQTRLNQAIGQLPELLDTIDDLASKWKAGRFAVLNKLELATAKNGGYGKEAASIARQLEGQIADVTADLGAVYMGGNSPTDHALQLAEKALGADWDEKTLHDMVALARKNVQTRQNSIRNTGVQGIDQSTNPYGPQAPPRPAGVPPSAVWVVDPSHVGGGYWKAGG